MDLSFLEDIYQKEVDERYVRPLRAAEQLKSAHSARQTVYISGATGFGKTSLVQDMLSRRRYRYYTARKWDEMLDGIRELLASGKSATEQIVVIDDLYVVDTSGAQELLYPMLEELSDRYDVWLILISRTAIPKWLKPIYIRHFFMQIGEDALKLSDVEEELLFQKWDVHPSATLRQNVKPLVDGHPLSLRVLALELQQLHAEKEFADNRLQEEQLAVQRAQEDLCDYMEIHVFNQWSYEMQDFMMAVSIVDEFDLPLAQMLTKRRNAGQMLQSAKELGTFLKIEQRNGTEIYSLRFIMKFAMVRRLRARCSQQYIDELYFSAASYYELAGNVVQALAMYEKAHNQEGISRVLTENAKNHPGKAKYWELRHYYLELSEDVVRKSPELMCGLSMLHSIMMNDEESERWYGELQKYTQQESGYAHKMAEGRLLYLDIVLPHRSIANVTELFRKVLPLIKERSQFFPEPSLTNNQPSIMHGGKDFSEWSKGDRKVADSIGPLITEVLGPYGKGIVNIYLAECYFEKGYDSYEISVLADQGRMQAESGAKQELRFVAIGILAQLAMLNNRVQDAIDMMDNLETSMKTEAPHLICGIAALRTRFMLLLEERAGVQEWMNTAPNEDLEFCSLDRYLYMTKVRCYLSVGDKNKALSLLIRLLTYAEKRDRVYLKIGATTLLAVTQYRMGNELWQESLQRAVSLAEEYHFVRILTREGGALLPLLNEAGDKLTWTDQKFKEQVLAECRTQATYYPHYLRERSKDIILSEMAIRVLQMQEAGLSNSQIAEKLELSVATIKYYNTETYRKLGVKGKTAAVTEARRRRLI